MKFATLALVALAVACSVIAVSADIAEECQRKIGAPNKIYDEYVKYDMKWYANDCEDLCESNRFKAGWNYDPNSCCCAK
jgi:hypothetical protein